MVYCRGCGKEIHETAPLCPLCGAPQNGPALASNRRSIGKLVAWGFVWTCVIWLCSLFALGFFAGALNPDNPGAAGEQLAQDYSVVLLLISAISSGALTFFGKLPGTKSAA